VDNVHSRPGWHHPFSLGVNRVTPKAHLRGGIEVTPLEAADPGDLPWHLPFGRMLRFYKNCTVIAAVTLTAFAAKPLAGMQLLYGVSGVFLAHINRASSTYNLAKRCSEQSLPKGGDAEPRGFGAFLCIMPAEPPAWGPFEGPSSLTAFLSSSVPIRRSGDNNELHA
jgi:hypothetical protein